MTKNNHMTDFAEDDRYESNTKSSAASRIIRFIVIGVIVIVFLAITLTSAPKNQDLGSIQDDRTILGNKNAKNHYVMITDVMCPYCTVFSRLTLENQEKFEKYLADHDIVFELRVTDFLYENNMDSYGFSKMSAEAVACATEQNKFWDYYHQVIRRLWQDYQSKGIGTSKNAPAIKDITIEYWQSIAKEVHLDESFNTCLSEHRMLDKVKQNTAEATTFMHRYNLNGMPSFKFGSLATSGFDTSWDYSYVERFLEAGLKK